jgi:hypothetical protein
MQKHSSELSDRYNSTIAESRKNVEVLNEESLSMKKYINSLWNIIRDI